MRRDSQARYAEREPYVLERTISKNHAFTLVHPKPLSNMDTTEEPPRKVGRPSGKTTYNFMEVTDYLTTKSYPSWCNGNRGAIRPTSDE